MRDALAPPLRIAWPAWPPAPEDVAALATRANFIELATWPPAHHLLKAATYILLILACAEGISRRELAPRDVPRAITASVVAGGLAVIFGDWAFSQLLLRREWQE